MTRAPFSPDRLADDGDDLLDGDLLDDGDDLLDDDLLDDVGGTA